MRGQPSTALQTTNQSTPTLAPSLPAKLTELLLSGDSPVVGPNTASQLRAFARQPDPAPADQAQVETMIGKLAIATAQPKVSEAEADARLEMYWLALRDQSVDDLRTAFMDLLRTATFLPTPAEIRTAAIRAGALRRYAKSRARHLAWKHDTEWREPAESVPPEQLQALLASVKIGAE